MLWQTDKQQLTFNHITVLSFPQTNTGAVIIVHQVRACCSVLTGIQNTFTHGYNAPRNSERWLVCWDYTLMFLNPLILSYPGFFGVAEPHVVFLLYILNSLFLGAQIFRIFLKFYGNSFGIQFELVRLVIVTANSDATFCCFC